jgi:uncharacterized membrane protein YdbT with pleckstrin-like domain
VSYISKILQPGESVLGVGRLHWIIYKGAILAFVVAIALFWIAYNLQGEQQSSFLAIGVFLLVISPLLAAKAWFDRWVTEIAVTNRRVIYKTGFISRHTVEMNMNRIESVTVTQSILGRALDYGTINVRGTGIGLEHIRSIRSPISLRNCITAH